jgi:hypothetical protein
MDHWFEEAVRTQLDSNTRCTPGDTFEFLGLGIMQNISLQAAHLVTSKFNSLGPAIGELHDLIGWGRIIEITVEPPLVECTVHERHDRSIIMLARNAISRLIIGWKSRHKQTVSCDTVRQYRRRQVQDGTNKR